MRDALAAVRDYHEATKHRTSGYAPSPEFLDWDSQPDPFRRFAGATSFPLPLVEGNGKCTYNEIYDASNAPPDKVDLNAIGLFFELAFGLSAWKSTGLDRWSLRNNPSSGNLHPTEAYLLLWQCEDGRLEPGLYHYAPYEHALELRARIPAEVARSISRSAPDTFGAIGLSSIIWREEWKYGARAYRYCQLDVGHVLGSARIAAHLNGWHVELAGSIRDDQITSCLGLNRAPDFIDAEAEHPDLMAVLATKTGAAAPSWSTVADALADWTGTANRLSAEHVAWQQIADVLPCVVKPPQRNSELPARSKPARDNSEQAIEETAALDAVPLIRGRRSAQRMDGQTGISRRDFERLLARILPQNRSGPIDGLPYAPAINLFLFVHSVEGLDPGLYLVNRCPDRWEAFLESCGAVAQLIRPAGDCELPLYRIGSSQNVRKLASQICCYQGIGGRGAFSLGMIADFQNVLETDGPWAYRRLYWECGLIGQVLYLEAEASGLRGTGIGCFFDDVVHELLGFGAPDTAPWQTLYHFTVGAAFEDSRLMTEPPYAHLQDRGEMSEREL